MKGRYITIDIETTEDVSLDEIMEYIDTEELIEELRKRGRYTGYSNAAIEENVSIDFSRKMDVVENNLYKFSYDEIYDFFENKKY